MLDFNGKITLFFLLLFIIHHNGKFLCVFNFVSGNELLDQSLPDEEYLQSLFTNERVDSDDSDWGEDFDRNVFEDVID